MSAQVQAISTASRPPGPPAVGGLPGTVLRLHRAALLVWAAFVAAVIVWLLFVTQVTAASVRAVEENDHCDPARDMCSVPYAAYLYSRAIDHAGTLVCYSFLAVAAFAAGSLIGRELESGTARLAWTQGVTPTRWLVAKLAVPAAAITFGGTVLVLAFRWGWAANPDWMWGDSWTFSDVFVALGPAAVAYALCALAVGALTALVLRRTLPALGVACAAMWLLNLVLEHLRDALWPTRTRTSAKPLVLPNDVWEVASGRDADGYYATFHPASHFWPLHLVETGLVLAVAAAATTAAFALLRRGTA
ncbi:ABC transporter permease [Streptomyces griseus]|uniref:ABC transporter permease n=1 Tax=Streptomyces griseus TaxID=1911 RepID=UPI0007C80C1E|nr:ABC transporter permease [Streptomyces griseus]